MDQGAHTTVQRVANREVLAVCAAQLLVKWIRADIQRSGHCNLALSGGSTPRALYELLAKPHYAEQIDWAKLQLWWGDERAVAPDDPASNYRMVKDALLDRLPVAPGAAQRIAGELGVEAAAVRYAQRIDELLAGPGLDILLLGMGDDGHTASLFPTAEARAGSEDMQVMATASVVVSRSPKPPHARISLSLNTLNTARRGLFLVAGEAKAGRLAQVFQQRHDGARAGLLPAACVQPREQLYWLLDEAAAAGLPESGLPESGLPESGFAEQGVEVVS